ncbi:hypothetical protein V492_07440 [Pseudogymnoascus sp. VKM F-4246]|nr:hypothetical protein V492_07440 [Pseudogymnoascus sp. VKM F-4246]
MAHLGATNRRRTSTDCASLTLARARYPYPLIVRSVVQQISVSASCQDRPAPRLALPPHGTPAAGLASDLAAPPGRSPRM